MLTTLSAIMTIGILGGMSNQATSEYYRLINERETARLAGWNAGENVINSINFGNLERFVRQDARAEARRYVAAKARFVERVGILGTKPVMAQSFLKDRYRSYCGIEVVAPDENDQRTIDCIIFDELIRRDLRTQSKVPYLETGDRLRRAGVEGVIWRCTEIFLLISHPDRPDLPISDTTSLHVDAALDFAPSGAHP